MTIDVFYLDWREQYFNACPPFYACPPFDRLSSYSSKGTKNTAPSFQSGESTPSSQEAHLSGVQIIRNALIARGFSQKAAKVIM